MLHKKALYAFLGLTFGLTLASIAIARAMGLVMFDKPQLYSQLIIAGAMFFPGLSAIIVQKFILKQPLKNLGFIIGPWRYYLKSYLTILALFAANYLVTWILVVSPDFSISSFVKLYDIPGGLPLPAPFMLALFAVLTFFLAPIFNLIPSLGEEIGWRGFLLPALEPLGQIKAALISSAIWALWHTPMILILGFYYGNQYWPGVLFHFAMVMGLGILMSYYWFKSRSTILAGFMHAFFNANAYGLWTIIFVSNDKLLVGAGGIIGVCFTILLGIYGLIKIKIPPAPAEG